MICPSCEHDYTKVLDTRIIPEHVRWSKRRRRCPNCLFVFWTIELPADDLEIGSEKGESSDEDDT